MRIIEGVGKDVPIITNEAGGKQSKVLYRFDLIDPHAIFAMARVLEQGSRTHGEENWRNIPVRDHLNHLLIHVYAYLAGDTQDDHLSHALCRAMMAVALQEDSE